MAARWLLTGYAHAWDGPNLLISCTSDVPAHLSLYWTDTPPTTHLLTSVHRGQEFAGDPAFGFVHPRHTPQAEPGDTLTHSFAFGPWAPCNRRWWYFAATINGILSPSNTAIFTDHYLDHQWPLSLGAYLDPITLQGNVKLEPGPGITITRNDAHNSLRIAHTPL